MENYFHEDHGVKIALQHIQMWYYIKITWYLRKSLLRVRSFLRIRIWICDQDHTDHGAWKERSFRVRSFGSMHVGYWALPWMAHLTARAFRTHYSLEAHFVIINSNDGIKTEANINYDMDTWEPWMPAISGRSI